MSQKAVTKTEQEDKEEKKDDVEPEMEVGDLPGVGPATIEKLENAGFGDLLSIAVATPGELVGADMSETTAKKVIAIARANMKMNFQSGQDIMKKRQTVSRIKTGSSQFDELLGGGVETSAITEAYGQYGAGKSQLAHSIAVRAQLPKKDGGAGGEVVYIDTEGTFRPERITQISEGAGIDAEKALKGIHVARAYNSDHQMLLAEKVKDLIKDGKDIKLVIVDSLTAHFRAEFVGRATLAERQQKLNKHLHTLLSLADHHDVAVYVTNQVMSKPDMFFGDPTKAVGGHIVAHSSTYRIYLRRGKKGSRVAKVIDAPNLAETEAVFRIDEKNGLKDA